MPPVLPLVAAFLAGGVNSIAGGGSFLTFPSLVAAGMPPVLANATSTVGLVPGAIASATTLKADLPRFEVASARAMVAVSVLGGLIGASILIFAPAKSFDVAVPFLLLVSTVCFAFGDKLKKIHGERVSGPAPVLFVQFLVAVYCGYFGAAGSLMMLAAWSVFGVTDVRGMSAMKNLLGASANCMASVFFAIAGKVLWQTALPMAVCAALGGYLAARYGRELSPKTVRVAITCTNVIVTTLFFARWIRSLHA
ncbi:MAG TPA: TSUP family transporter [Polyangiaceae bacterium]